MQASAGHEHGVASLRMAVDVCCELGVQGATAFAMSFENAGRPREEIAALLSLMEHTVSAELPVRSARQSGACGVEAQSFMNTCQCTGAAVKPSPTPGHWGLA